MKRQPNRVMWQISAILAVALVGGIGAMLIHGVTLGRDYVALRFTGRWSVGREPCFCDPGTCGWSYDLGFVRLDRAGPDPRCAK